MKLDDNIDDHNNDVNDDDDVDYRSYAVVIYEQSAHTFKIKEDFIYRQGKSINSLGLPINHLKPTNGWTKSC